MLMSVKEQIKHQKENIETTINELVGIRNNLKFKYEEKLQKITALDSTCKNLEIN